MRERKGEEEVRRSGTGRGKTEIRRQSWGVSDMPAGHLSLEKKREGGRRRLSRLGGDGKKGEHAKR